MAPSAKQQQPGAGKEPGTTSEKAEDQEVSPARRRWEHAGAFSIYTAAWLAAMGPKILLHLHDRILAGITSEPSIFLWSFAWWPHALTHTANPLLSSAVWAPTGLNLAWATTLPGPSIIASPITVLAGPVVSFNVMTLLGPPVTAWSAYLLSSHLTRRFLAGLAGGALYGFSPVVIREVLQGHLNLSLLFPIPLAAYLVVRRVEGSLSQRAFVLLLAAVLVAEFSIFTELFLTMVIVGALVALAALLLAAPPLRGAILETARLSAVSLAISVTAVLPYVLTAFAYPRTSKPPDFHGLATGLRTTRDLERYVVPGRGFLIGEQAGPRLGNVNFWYFGIPLLLILAAFWVAGRRSFGARLLCAGFSIAIVLSLGRALPLGGLRIPLPWALLAHLPVVGRVRAGRIVQYAFLFASLSAALWFAEAPRRSLASAVRGVALAAALIALLPNVGGSFWTSSVPTPAFFSTQAYRTVLCPGEIVAVVDPANTNQLRWQASTDFYFRISGWDPGTLPLDYVDLHTSLLLQRGRISLQDAAQVRGFLLDHQVTAILVPLNRARDAATLQQIVGPFPRILGGIMVLRVGSCSASKSATATR